MALDERRNSNVIICSEDNFFELASNQCSRHPLKCDRSRQEPIAEKERFSYNRFSQYVNTKFVLEGLRRKQVLAIHSPELQLPPPLDHYTNDVLKQELFDIYGRMDETSKKFKLIFENYKEERLQQIRQWMKDEQDLFLDDDSTTKSESQVHTINVPAIQEVFSIDEIVTFDKVSIYHLVNKDVFLLPREVHNDHSILQEYVLKKKKLNSLTSFDPDINIEKLIIPEICDINVGTRLTETMVDIIKKHPQGITNAVFLSELKQKMNHYPDHKELNYSSFAEMMKDLGKHIIFIQDMPRYDSFYYPMCLQGLICPPKDMFWNIWHKIKIVLNLHRGIVKISTAMKFARNLFGWESLDLRGWGFDRDDLLIGFLIEQWGESDIIIMPETEFKPKGRSEVKYLVFMTEDRRKYLRKYSTKIEANVSKLSISDTTTTTQKPMQDFPSLTSKSQLRPKGQTQVGGRNAKQGTKQSASKPKTWKSLF